MNMSDFEQIRKRLDKEYKENNLKINELDKKIKIVQENQFDTRIVTALGFSMFLWFGFEFLVPFIIKMGIISLNLIQLLSIVVPVFLGITLEKLLFKRAKCLEKLRKFSNSKTQKELIEESINYEIEQEKLRSANKILKNNYDILLSDENLVDYLSLRYDINERNIGRRTSEEISDSVDKMGNILKKKQQEVDVMTTRNYLKTKFWKIRNKAVTFSDVLVFGAIGGLFLMIIYNLPNVCFSHIINLELTTTIFQTIVPTVMGALFCGGYYLNRSNNYKYVFKAINDRLGNKAISRFSNYKDDKKIEKNLESAINDACKSRLKFEIEKQELVSDLNRYRDKSFLVTKGNVDDKEMMYSKEECLKKGKSLKKTIKK